MKTLFDDFEDFQPVPKVELKITTKQKDKLTKEQTAFNRLLSRIQSLENSINNDTEKADLLFAYFEKEVRPQIFLLAEKQIQFAQALSELSNRIELTKKSMDQLSDMIVYSCDLAFQFVTVTPEMEELYDEWSEVPYQDELKSQRDEANEQFSDFFEEMYGKKVNLDDVDVNDPESVARFQARMKELFEEFKHENSKDKSRKKSKKQIKLEEQEKVSDLIKNKSLRSIYITLSKALHPDTETDEALKNHKLELMKSVTIAYEQKDLKTLLRLEMEWVYKTSEHLEQLAEDKLKVYISVLKERVSELEVERQMIKQNPRFMNITDYIGYPHPVAMNYIKKERLEKINEIKYYEVVSKNTETVMNKKQAKVYLSELHEVVFRNYFDDFLY
jgi:hypothetical protein